MKKVLILAAFAAVATTAGCTSNPQTNAELQCAGGVDTERDGEQAQQEHDRAVREADLGQTKHSKSPLLRFPRAAWP